MKPWLGNAWEFGYVLPGVLTRDPQLAAIWQITGDQKELLAQHTADLLESLPPQWFDRIFKLLETTLPGFALVGTVTLLTMQKLSLHAYYKSHRDGVAQHTAQAPQGGADVDV